MAKDDLTQAENAYIERIGNWAAAHHIEVAQGVDDVRLHAKIYSLAKKDTAKELKGLILSNISGICNNGEVKRVINEVFKNYSKR